MQRRAKVFPAFARGILSLITYERENMKSKESEVKQEGRKQRASHEVPPIR